MKFILYTRENPPCPHCNSAKQLLESNKMEYHSNVIGKDLDIQEFLDTFPGQKSVPLIFVVIDGQQSRIGGYTELKAFIDKINTTKGLSL